MAIPSASISVGATVAASGGTAKTLKELNRSQGLISTYLDEGLSFQTRREISFSTKTPKVSPSAPGNFTQARSIVLLKSPKTLANLKTTVNTLQLSLSVDPETTSSEVQDLLVLAAQLLTDSDFSDFWKAQALA